MKWIDIPPVWLIAGCVLAWAQARYVSFGLSLPWPVVDLLAGLFVGGGILLIGLAVAELRRHKTTVVPHLEAEDLVTTGIFSKSRNPIYLADVLMLAGVVLWLDAVLSLLFVPTLLWILEKRFVLPEENRLRRKFRVNFARYCEKTRRWI